MNKKETSNDYIYLTILTVMTVFGIGTILHDPLLHSIIALLNGWHLNSYTISLGTGSTDAFATPLQLANTPTFNYWLFYMFPSLFIFILSFMIILFNPNRLIIVAGLIFMSLNFSSLLPGLPGSDAYNAIQFLISRGWSEPHAFALHYIILIVMFIIWSLYLYIVIENSPRDIRSRTQNIWR